MKKQSLDISGVWAGNIYGTNTSNLFITIEQKDSVNRLERIRWKARSSERWTDEKFEISNE